MMFGFKHLLSSALLALLVACSPPRPVFKATDITGAAIGGPFALNDHQGRLRSLEQFRGKVVVLFFGYTHCPDVCPTTLFELKQAMSRLGPRADQVQVVFVTVDPERDTPEVLRQYVPSFDPRFLGLTGTPEAIRQVTQRYKVYYARSSDNSMENYTVDHMAGSYILDRQGKIRLFVNYGAGAEVFVHDLGLLLDERA
jgi:protein SCO1/2